MSGFPTAFHIGPFVFHTYGLGLAIAAFVTYSYAQKRLERATWPTEKWGRFTGWMIASGLVGARLANIFTNWDYYRADPGRWFSVWQGGLASFGGIALALIVGIPLFRRYWPKMSLLEFCDCIVPALIAGWALGRVLGPQFMVNGGGHLTHQWFGIHYQGQFGKRVPVPLIQGAEDGLLWAALLALSRSKWSRIPGRICGIGMIVWGLVRSLDEKLLLGQQSHSGSDGVQIAGLLLALGGLVVVARSFRRSNEAPAA